MAAKKQKALPKTLGACADRLYELRGLKSELTKQVDELEAERKRIEEHLINELPKSQAGGIKGSLARAEVVRKTAARIDDWTKFYAFVLKTKDFSLMQKRVNEAAIKERWEDGKTVPGSEPFHYVKVSVTKA